MEHEAIDGGTRGNGDAARKTDDLLCGVFWFLVNSFIHHGRPFFI